MLYCSTVTYISVFLLECGYSNTALGIVQSISIILGIALQPIVSAIVDRSKRVTLNGMSLGLVVTALACNGIMAFLHRESMVLNVVCVGLAASIILLQPLINALPGTLSRLGEPINYGVGRACGSGMYAMLSVLIGELLVRFNGFVLPIVSVVPVVLLFVMLVLIRREGEPEEIDCEADAPKDGAGTLFRNGSFVCFLIGVAFLFFGHTPLDYFGLQIVSAVGGDGAGLGRVHALLAVSELPTMIFFTRLEKRFSSVTLLRISAIVFVINSILFALSSSMSALCLSCIMHCFGYALLIPASVRYAEQISDRTNGTLAQSLVTIAMMAGSFVCSFTGGIIIDATNERTLLIIAAVVSVVGAIPIVFGMKQSSIPKKSR